MTPVQDRGHPLATRPPITPHYTELAGVSPPASQEPDEDLFWIDDDNFRWYSFDPLEESVLFPVEP